MLLAKLKEECQENFNGELRESHRLSRSPSISTRTENVR